MPVLVDHRVPDYVLKRQLGWLVYSIVRTSIIERIPGRHSAWMKLALREFFLPAQGRPSFRSGIVVASRDRAFMVRCKYAGFIADEKALKDFMGFKGGSWLGALHNVPQSRTLR